MTKYSLEDLLYLMSRLRDPETGCPWDVKQTYKTIAPYTIEEAYEVVDAIENGDLTHLEEELGDLLLQVVFYGQLAKEEGAFEFDSVVDKLTAKLLRRHPHVFPDGTLSSRISAQDLASNDVKKNWESLKQDERSNKGHKSLIADIPKALPALKRAQKIQKRVAKVGFDWTNTEQVFAKIEEEFNELKVEISNSTGQIKDELGDVLFSVVNLARHLGLDAEEALREANNKFSQRFELMEKSITEEGKELSQQKIEELEEKWQLAKAALASSKSPS